MMLPESDLAELTKDEQQRIDDLLSAARGFHYSAFALSGISLVLSSLEKIDGFKLPLGDVIIPSLQTAVGMYVLVLVLTLCAERLFNMAYPWMKKDPRRIPFPWIALSSRETTSLSVAFWLMLPAIVCGISTANALVNKDITSITLSFLSAFLVLLPRSIEHYWYLIRKRLDHRGGSATLSMWLLYCYRLENSLTITAFWFAPVIAVVPKWRDAVWRVAYPLILVALGIFLLRIVAGFPFVYRRIDRLGGRLGFTTTSKHYK